MFSDYIMNGEGHGPVGAALQELGYDLGLLRPYVDDDGKKYCTVNTGKKRYDEKLKKYVPIRKKVSIEELRDNGIDLPIYNTTLLRKDEWLQIDASVKQPPRQRMRLYNDLLAANRIGGFDAMATPLYEYEAVNDPGEAVQDMDVLSDGRADEMLYKLLSAPLPVTHSGFWLSRRRLMMSRAKGMPLTTTLPAAGARRVAEKIEKVSIGVDGGIQYGPTSSTDTRYTGTSKNYGITTFPFRITKTDLTTPTGLNPEAVKQDVIEMRELQYANGYFGPFMLYHTPAYDAYFDDDYFRTGGTSANTTLRARIGVIDGIMGAKRLDFWSGSPYQMVLVQMTDNVVGAVDGMPITPVQWESKGGMKIHIRVIAIQVALFFANFDGESGIVHGTTS